VTSSERNAARRARFGLLGSMFTTYGYAIIGAAIIQPFLTGQMQMTESRGWAILLALAFQGAALYIAPRGEKP